VEPTKEILAFVAHKHSDNMPRSNNYNLNDAVFIAKELQRWMGKKYYAVKIERDRMMLFKNEKDKRPTVIHCSSNLQPLQAHRSHRQPN
jgi:hypothetical protein